MMKKFREKTQREKVKCKTALTATSGWIKNQKDKFKQIETADMLMNDYECLERAIRCVTDLS